jgi:uncharacterized protein (DUF885 family)
MKARGLFFTMLAAGGISGLVRAQAPTASSIAAVPAFRRETFDTAYTEGWGEYASELAEEMGMYSDPYHVDWFIEQERRRKR